MTREQSRVVFLVHVKSHFFTHFQERYQLSL